MKRYETPYAIWEVLVVVVARGSAAGGRLPSTPGEHNRAPKDHPRSTQKPRTCAGHCCSCCCKEAARKEAAQGSNKEAAKKQKPSKTRYETRV